MREDSFGKGFVLRVNGEDVEGLEPAGSNCFVLRSATGLNFQANEEGTYRFEVKVNSVKEDVVSYFRISTLVLL